MKIWIKRIVKAVSFLLIFAIVFSACQFVLHYRWAGDEDIYTRNTDFERQPENSLDVLYFGTSEIYAGVSPIITYASEGITGYNFAVSYKSAITAYYQLLYALKHQTPKIVVCDFDSLFEDELPSQDNEALYRKIYETMPDKTIRRQLLSDILRYDRSQDYLSWRFPLLRYHSIWSDLKKENFEPDDQIDPDYKSYEKGALLNSKAFIGEGYDVTPDLWRSEGKDLKLSDVSVTFYDRFIEACKEKGIKVVAVITPKIAHAARITNRWPLMKEYLDSRGVDYLLYNSFEQVERMQLSFEEHYYDTGHLNTIGALVFSETLAADLKERYGLASRKEDPTVAAEWDAAYSLFVKELPAQQPNLEMCLSLIRALGLDAMIYVNDTEAVGYQKYSEPLERRGIDHTKLENQGIVLIRQDGSSGEFASEAENRVPGIGHVKIVSGDGISVLINGEEQSVLRPSTGASLELCVFALENDSIVSTVKFEKTVNE